MIVLRLVLALALLAATPAWAGQNVLDTDSFTGTAGTALPTYNANWVTAGSGDYGNLNISTPNGGVANFGANYRTGFSWTNDQWAEFTVVTVSDAAFGRQLVCVRVGTGATFQGYCGGEFKATYGAGYAIYSFNGAGTSTRLAGPTGGMTVGDVVNFEAVGTTLNLRVNGSIVLTTTDATYTTNNPAINLSNVDTTAKMLNAWRAGSVGSGTVKHRSSQ